MKKFVLFSLFVASFGATSAFAQPGITVSVGSGGFNNSVQWGVSVGSGYPGYQSYPVYQNNPGYSNYPVYNNYPINYPIYNNVPVSYPGYNLNNYNSGCGQRVYQSYPAYQYYGHGRHRHCR